MGYNDLPALQARIIVLERENASLLAENGHLRKLLADAGIAITPVPAPPDLDQGARIIFPDAITTHMANRSFSYFWGRQDVYAKRSVKKDTGAAGYYRLCANLWRYGCHRRSRDKVQCKDCEMRETFNAAESVEDFCVTVTEDQIKEKKFQIHSRNKRKGQNY